MINNTAISKTLTDIESLYNIPSSSNYTEYCAKLALLELSGWVEENMEEIIRIAKNKLTERNNIDYIEKGIIKKNHGFSYNDHFRKMLLITIGIKNVEKIEKQIDKQVLDKFKSNLGVLYQRRNEIVHTYIRAGITITLDAPSKIKTYLQPIYVVLAEFENQLNKI